VPAAGAPVVDGSGRPGAGRLVPAAPKGEWLSSAILYVAIVAIWAGVLIPRWLRRDSSASTVAAEAEDETVVDSAIEEEPEPEPAVSAPRRRRRSDASSERRSVPAVPAFPVSVPAVPAVPVSVPAVHAVHVSGPGSDEDRAEPADRAHRRVLSARRRLLLILLALGIAAGALAGTRMAAWWVVVPPSVMLLGYLLLLRAAVKAGAERREMAQYLMARAAAEAARVPAQRPAPARRVAAGRPAASAPASPAARTARASEAKIISIPAAPDPEEIYDQYADAKLRAVGD